MWIGGLLIAVSALAQADDKPRFTPPRGSGTPRPATGTPRPATGTPRPAAPATPAEADGPLEPEPATPEPPAAAPPAVVSPPAIEPEPSGRPLVDVKPIKHHLGAVELLREALAAPKTGVELSGQPLSLATALSLAERGKHLEVTRLYWKLSHALCEYHYAVDEHQRFMTLIVPEEPPQPAAVRVKPLNEQPLADRLQIEQSTSRARMREAELEALLAQHELATALGGVDKNNLPLPSDEPHVGQYRTLYQQVFGSRNVSPRLRYIDRALPLQRQVIDLRADAILSAEDSAVTAAESFKLGQTKLAEIVARLADLQRHRRAFIASIELYNGEIAEYAVAAGGEQTAVTELVSMMIKSPLPADGAALPAVSPPNKRPNTPTPAVRPSDADKPPAIDGEASESENSAGRPVRRFVARAGGRRFADPFEGVESTPAGADTQHIDSPLYAALTSLSPVKRTHQLAVSLHFDQHLPPDSGTRTALDEVLAQAAPGQRHALAAAYWKAREQVARQHVLAEQFKQLCDYTPILLDKRKTESGARAMVELRTAKLAAEAALMEGRLAMQEAQLELTRLAGRPLDGPWLLPSTSPHAGRYRVDQSAAPSARERLATAAVGGRFDALIDRAAAVVLADSARAQAATEYKLNERVIDELLAAVEIQTQESFDFLSALTRYNLAILDYVDVVLPRTNGDRYLELIVVKP